MSPERWQQVKELMLSAAERPSAEQSAFLTTVCGDDVSLRRQVESLLCADRLAADFLEAPAFQVTRESAHTTRRKGSGVGPYEILREIGRGGMGTVYLAVRPDDDYGNQVALKVLERGLVDEHLVRRFRAEGRILARLEHPSIARLLDGGTTIDGVPYLAMELVQGEPIDRFCRNHGLTFTERLKLFRRVCSAVHFAHRNLVVHRDLKPSNILVTADGTPKLLDFGIAKLLEPKLPLETATVTGLRFMTPEYASPEQVRGEAITTATDVYSLGLVLYLLLTGRHPYHLRKGSAKNLARVICEEEPPRPSAALDQAAGAGDRRGSGGGRQSLRRLRADLDHIVLRALRKEPEKRYGSVEQLSEDVERHLSGLPVLARQGSVSYRLSKLLRRHALAAGAAAAVVILALTLAMTMAVQQRQVARERDRAEQVSQFLVDMFETADPYGARGPTVPARQLLDWGAAELREEFGDQPEVRAALMDTIGKAYLNLGFYEEASLSFESALDTRRESLGARDVLVAESLHHLGQTWFAKGDYRRAAANYREALAIREERLGARSLDVANSLDSLAGALLALGHHEEAEALLREALAIERELAGEPSRMVATTLRHLAKALARRGDLEGATTAARESLTVARQVHGREHPEVASSLDVLAQILIARGRLGEAEELGRKALELRRRIFEPDHPDVVASAYTLARLVTRRGDFAAAEALYRDVVAVNRELLGEVHANVAAPMNNLAQVLHAQGDGEAAEPYARQALAIYRQVHGEEHPAVATAMGTLATLLRDRGDLVNAERLHLSALAMRRRLFDGEHLHVAVNLHRLARLEQLKGEVSAAERLYRDALAMKRRLVGPDHPRIASALDDLARLLAANPRVGSTAEAEASSREALAMRRRLLGEDHPDVARSLSTLASVRAAQGDCVAAVKHGHDALTRLRRQLPGHRQWLAEAQATLDGCSARAGRVAEVERSITVTGTRVD